MAKPAFIRYLPVRLKPLGNPIVWVPLTALGLLGLFTWEFYRNPDWFSRAPITSLTPDSQLTPEEEARLSEIDTLDVLLRGTRLPDGTATVTSQINPASGRKSNDDDDGSDANLGLDLGAYPIPGAASTPTTLRPAQPSVYSDTSQPTTREGSLSSGFNFGDGLSNTTAPAPASSALADALNRREADLAAIEQPSAARDSTARDSNRSGAQLGLENSGTTVDTLPNANSVPGAFSRTTPEMSPPAGTTGYQVPATSRVPTFNVAPQQPTRSPYSLPTSQFAVPTPSIGQAVPAPATVAAPVMGAQSPSAPSGSSSGRSSGLYTQPSSFQPDQGPAINPRR